MVLHTLQQSNAQTTTPHKHPTFAEEAQQELQSSYAERSKPFLKEADVLKARHNYWTLRRAQDIVLSFLALVVLSPLFLLICLAVWLDDPKGSPIFSQERIGWRGKPFKLYKFRTMCVNAESMLSELMKQNEMDGPVFKIRDDPRVTRVGKLLRRTSLDELPQLLNILKGDMSFVGPRPALRREVEQYSGFDRQRLYVTPGLTCYWQIQPNRNDISFEEWMDLDVKYLRDQSFVNDWKILFRTVISVFAKSGC